MTRRKEFAQLLPALIRSERNGSPVHLTDDIYPAVERDHPWLVDDEIEASTGVVRWKHELRWELETLVRNGRVVRRKELGRGFYSAS